MSLSRALFVVLGLVTLAACRDTPSEVKDPLAVDADEDGYTLQDDCDDNNPDVHPGADELCNGWDDDCDEIVDDMWSDDAKTFYADDDADGFGTARLELRACVAPSGFVDNADDCDDTDAAVSPVADETCDGRDDDCDGVVDEDSAIDALSWYQDADGDGHANPEAVLVACTAPADFVLPADADIDDCDDQDAAVSPDADELCNGKDDNCDGTVDEGAALDAELYYPDLDGDSFGDGAFPVAACEQPVDHVQNTGDCDDGSRWVSPEAIEVCNGIDDDCDGTPDGFADGRAAIDATQWFADSDGDGFAAAALSVSTTACTAPVGMVAVPPGASLDCDDTSVAISPAATEVCNGDDDDCDGTVDGATATDAIDWYRDADGDTFGFASIQTRACAQPTGYVASSTDCDDTRDSVFPGATEVCNGRDDDCDPGTDEDLVGADTSSWYPDVDADGHGDDSASATLSCEMPAGMVSLNDDCNDNEALAWTGADEVCSDAVDNDCDGGTDDANAVDARSWYADVDGDGFGDATTLERSCTAVSGKVTNANDCNDSEKLAWAGADEVCSDSVDNDCDGNTDDGAAIDADDWFLDDDGDGYGFGAAVRGCVSPGASYVLNDGDCLDTAGGSGSPDPEDVNVDAVEICDGFDNDCDALIDDDDSSLSASTVFYADVDGDGYGDPAGSRPACAQPSGYVVRADDCDDDNADINPAGTEICNGLDDDCDATSKEDGIVSLSTDGGLTWTDATSVFISNTSPSVAFSGTSRRYNFCAGTWYPLFDYSGSGTLQINGFDGPKLSGNSVRQMFKVSSGGTLDVAGVNLNDGFASGNGGAISCSSGTVVLEDVSVARAETSSSGAGLYGDGCTLALNNVEFEDGAADDDGGAIVCEGGSLTLANAYLGENTAGSKGGALHLRDCAADITDTDAVRNTATYGGAVVAERSGTSASAQLNWTTGTLSKNDASIGGGVFLAGGGAFPIGARLEGVTVSGSTAGSYGGGFYVSGAELDLVSSEVLNNVAAYGGAGAYVQGSAVNMDSSLFDGNATVSQAGGGMLLHTSDLVCTSPTSSASHGFINNTAPGQGFPYGAGGAVYMHDSNSTITSTSCNWGTGSSDNASDDIAYYSLVFKYSGTASFFCSGGYCP